MTQKKNGNVNNYDPLDDQSSYFQNSAKSHQSYQRKYRVYKIWAPNTESENEKTLETKLNNMAKSPIVNQVVTDKFKLEITHVLEDFKAYQNGYQIFYIFDKQGRIHQMLCSDQKMGDKNSQGNQNNGSENISSTWIEHNFQEQNIQNDLSTDGNMQYDKTPTNQIKLVKPKRHGSTNTKDSNQKDLDDDMLDTD